MTFGERVLHEVTDLLFWVVRHPVRTAMVLGYATYQVVRHPLRSARAVLMVVWLLVRVLVLLPLLVMVVAVLHVLPQGVSRPFYPLLAQPLNRAVFGPSRR